MNWSRPDKAPRKTRTTNIILLCFFFCLYFFGSSIENVFSFMRHCLHFNKRENTHRHNRTTIRSQNLKYSRDVTIKSTTKREEAKSLRSNQPRNMFEGRKASNMLMCTNNGPTRHMRSRAMKLQMFQFSDFFLSLFSLFAFIGCIMSHVPFTFLL